MQSLCCMLANAAFESVGDAKAKRLSGNPIFEVSSETRAQRGNPTATLGNFFPKEPKLRGEWGKGIVLDETLRRRCQPAAGRKTCFYGTLSPADLLYLLQDVEALLV